MKNKLHITLTNLELQELNELKDYYKKFLNKTSPDFQIPNSWMIGSCINSLYKDTFPNNKITD